MAIDLSRQLHELQNSTNDLNALTDKANDVVRRVEIFLRDTCRIGGWGSVYVPPPEDYEEPENGATWETCLEYQRYKGDYRIIVTHLLNSDPHESKPWSECSRDIKLQALEALPALIDELHKKVKKQIAHVQGKIDLLDSMIPSVNELQPRPSAKKKG
jgi:hypothetical protein